MIPLLQSRELTLPGGDLSRSFTAETAVRPLDRWGSKKWITRDHRRGQDSRKNERHLRDYSNRLDDRRYT
jgi:hypothetical protein